LAVERDQAFLMPPSLTEWLEEDHLAWFVLDAVDQMDLSAFHADYRADGWGRAAHDPKMMVALTLYAYCIGMRSSRAIERACRVDVAFRVIAANQAPDHTTVARFRQRHEQALASMFTESLRLCAQAGMVKVGLVAVDGTKMGCPAALAANRTKSHIDEQVAAMLAEAAEVDAREDARLGSMREGTSRPRSCGGRRHAGSGSPPPRSSWTQPRSRRRPIMSSILPSGLPRSRPAGGSCGAANPSLLRRRPRRRRTPRTRTAGS